MLESLFDLPLAITGPAIVGSLWLYSLTGLVVVRRYVLPRLRIRDADSDFSSGMLQAVMVFYGLAVALMAVSTWQTYSDVAKIVSGEATALAALYRDVSGYPEPIRPQLQGEIRDYVQNIIEESWPLQRRGLVPTSGVERMNRFQAILIGFEPATEGQKLLHGETLRAYNHMILNRNLRLDAVGTGLPALMWGVIIAGACIGLCTSFLFKVEDARFHAIQVLLLATFVSLVIFMILALDRPFRGDLGIGSEPYQLIYNRLMKVSP